MDAKHNSQEIFKNLKDHLNSLETQIIKVENSEIFSQKIKK
jgi:hypothetical protein